MTDCTRTTTLWHVHLVSCKEQGVPLKTLHQGQACKGRWAKRGMKDSARLGGSSKGSRTGELFRQPNTAFKFTLVFNNRRMQETANLKIAPVSSHEKWRRVVDLKCLLYLSLQDTAVPAEYFQYFYYTFQTTNNISALQGRRTIKYTLLFDVFQYLRTSQRNSGWLRISVYSKFPGTVNWQPLVLVILIVIEDTAPGHWD